MISVLGMAGFCLSYLLYRFLALTFFQLTSHSRPIIKFNCAALKQLDVIKY